MQRTLSYTVTICMLKYSQSITYAAITFKTDQNAPTRILFVVLDLALGTQT